MKTFYLLLFSILISFGSFAQNVQYQEVIYLKNGSIIRGTIIEQVPNKTYKIKTADGNVFVYNIEDVLKITKEEVYKNPNQQYNNSSFENKPYKKVKEPILAWGLSFLLPGVGQYYNGQIWKGVIMNTVYVGSFIGMLSTYDATTYYALFGTFIGTWIWSQIDAPLQANKINRAVQFQGGLLNNSHPYLSTDLREFARNNIPMGPTTQIGLKVSFNIN